MVKRGVCSWERRSTDLDGSRRHLTLPLTANYCSSKTIYKVYTMSRKAAIVEEFDDDTDLPLPNNPLPNTGSRGPLLEELHISDDEFEAPRAGPASQSQRQPFQATNQRESSESDSGFRQDATRTVMDITPYKTYVHLDDFISSRLIISQMDVYIPHLSRREAPLWHR